MQSETYLHFNSQSQNSELQRACSTRCQCSEHIWRLVA